MLAESRHIAVGIQRPPDVVYAYAADARNVPQWAPGLARSVRQDGEDWIAESPMGTIRIRFVRRNDFGVLDHSVDLPSGERVHNPMRVMPNGNGCKMVFSLFRRAGVSDQEFQADASAVLRDLQSLKRIMEAQPPRR